ncbi:MAG: hypothetical protein CV089_01290 [Nitrospira sp. WS110]|nr:hypothetical protein [Nitrospira sp. WS110]
MGKHQCQHRTGRQKLNPVLWPMTDAEQSRQGSGLVFGKGAATNPWGPMHGEGLSAFADDHTLIAQNSCARIIEKSRERGLAGA